jgi:IS30 family transposase
MLVCSQSRAAILSIKDTRSGKAFLRPVSSLEAAKVRVAISNVLYNIPPYIPKSMLFDRGSEFANAHQLELLHRITTYFCDAYKAWQKGAVEEQNKEIRRYIPKGTDLSTITEEKLGRIESLLNTKPRRRLGGLAADDLWFFELRAAKRALH